MNSETNNWVFDFAGLAEEAEEAETHGTRVNVNKTGTLNNIHVSCVSLHKVYCLPQIVICKVL